MSRAKSRPGWRMRSDAVDRDLTQKWNQRENQSGRVYARTELNKITAPRLTHETKSYFAAAYS
jgi:hypothetical protein